MTPWIEENEPYVEALNMSAFSNLSINVLYFFRWADAFFEDFWAFGKFLTDVIIELGIPLELDADDMFPDDQFIAGLRTGRDTDLFGNPWIQNAIAGEPGGDVWSPDSSVPGGPDNPKPDGNVDGWDFLGSANSLTVTISLILVLKFAGKDLLKFFSGSGGWVEKSTRTFNPKLRYYRAAASFDDVDIHVGDESPNDDLSAFLDATETQAVNYGPSIIRALDQLATALDTNKTNDYLQFKDFIASIDNPERIKV